MQCGKFLDTHPTQFHSGIAHMPLGSLIEALICEEAIFVGTSMYTKLFRGTVDIMTKLTKE